ncbi:GxxExxY protein [Hymenobacter sp. BRD67]|uniref:GxxExxY protein n=1 Tax=Hymenobacter sp. BRD67 TaxID=2675877 RepID=UPI0015638601|nr:GxxExxY protein [Hymenobacter sp. BRD67]QKG53994.1 GxxExxY protein [Hymenobacter sp. BRD67]
MHENVISGHILTAAFRVHTVLGPGLMEAVYEAALMHELRKAGLRVESQVPLPVIYDGVRLEVGYRLDLLVEDKVVVELKSVESFHPMHAKQLTNYLKLSKFKLGLLLNFNVPSLKDHIVRIVNGL